MLPHECLTISDIELVSVRPCICSAVHRVLDFNLPHPSLSVIHCSCTLHKQMKTATENHFVFMVEILPGRFPPIFLLENRPDRL